MSFHSNYQHKIWDYLYTVSIPDQLTINRDYAKVFGVYQTGNKKFDEVGLNNFTTVKIPVVKILEYYETGYEIRIHSREDMITIHKDIEAYLAEWREYLRYAVNIRVADYKELLLGLEKLSKYIYEKAQPREVINKILDRKRFGLVNPVEEKRLSNEKVSKPEYDGISKLVKQRVKLSTGSMDRF